MQIYQDIIANTRKKLAILIDPDKTTGEQLISLCRDAQKANIDVLLVGGSLLWNSVHETIAVVKQHCSIPVVIFPGNVYQVCANADGILLLSLISGRNPDFLIGQHVLAAPAIKQSSLEVIPTGYILIESGKTTAVEYMSNTKPIPANKIDIIVATAIAGEMLGLKMLYLEGGSGADSCICSDVIQAINQATSVPIVVGGGVRTVAQMKELFSAGADMVVLGTIIEEQPQMIFEFGREKLM